MIKFHFEDRGQDFLWWLVEDNDTGVCKVVDCGPFQSWAWADGQHYVNTNEPCAVGDKLTFTSNLDRSIATGHSLKLAYRITKVEYGHELESADV